MKFLSFICAVFMLVPTTGARSRTEVAYLVDPSITFDVNQKNALFNALLDLNSRTCLRFLPRSNQKDYILFTDMGPNTVCWNVFGPIVGQVNVNGGEFCIRPMHPPYKFKEVFSNCDIQYINAVHECPQADSNFDTRCTPSGFLKTTTISTPTTTPVTAASVFAKLQKTTSPMPTLPSPQPISSSLLAKPNLRTITNKSCGSACFYSGELTPLYRAYNEKIGVTDHFYTTDRIELQTMAVEGYIIQRQMGYIAKNEVDLQCSCLTPLFRLFNDAFKDHMYTTNIEEKSVAEKVLGYSFEGIEGYCTKSPGCGAYLPFYRHFNPIAKDHMYTVDQMEKNYYETHPHHGYYFERIECYIWQYPESHRSCDNTVDSF
ncbi:hypothetical protein QR680_001554 [Steinernema hermaphroditum]|uniref:DUF5648 domain-containing protein n=1 Tax=Steinernema hermaphroditum TaxID=289476 RepID=A0AA39GZK5_9BILA|nr:hypothetical protein QR680_001554 [Steinernema hermaphroditum]